MFRRQSGLIGFPARDSLKCLWLLSIRFTMIVRLFQNRSNVGSRFDVDSRVVAALAENQAAVRVAAHQIAGGRQRKQTVLEEGERRSEKLEAGD